MFKAKEKFVKKRRRYKRKLHATRYTLHATRMGRRVWETLHARKRGERGKRYYVVGEGIGGRSIYAVPIAFTYKRESSFIL